MERRKTIFIVGAGASAEVQMPVGSELRNEIEQLLSFGMSSQRTTTGDEIMRGLFHEMSPGTEHAQGGPFEVASMLRNAVSLARSIDNLLDAHRDNQSAVRIGKAAICRAILRAEAKSTLQVQKGTTRFTSKKMTNTWYVKLLHLIVDGCSFKELETKLEGVVIVTFNYDRTIEHFLLNSISSYYNVPIDSVISLVGKIQIVHPYGVVGTLPFEKKADPVEFGGIVKSAELLKLSDNIVTFSEGAIQTEDLNWGNAKSIVFLGFAYHKINMRLLFRKPLMPPPDMMKEPVRIYGTAVKVSSSDKEAIKTFLWQIFGGKTLIEFFPGSCYDLFDEYQRSIEF